MLLSDASSPAPWMVQDAEAIIQLLRDPQQRAEFRQRNLSLIRERADHRVEMAKMEALYYTLVAKEKYL